MSKKEQTKAFRVQVQFNTGTQVHKPSKGKGSYKRNKGNIKNALKKNSYPMGIQVG